MPPYPLPDTDPAYTMAPGAFNPQDAVPSSLDPATMSTLFGDDTDQDTSTDESQGAAEDAGADVDQDKRMQNILSDPEMLKTVAEVLKHLGTGDDTDLVHVTDREKAMLKRAGGKGTVNPTTGLLQYASSGGARTDWAGMSPEERVKKIAAGNYSQPPGWSNNWWMNPRSTGDATQGNPVRNMTPAEFASMNAAVNPSWGNALGMAGLVTALGMGGPLGLAMKIGLGQLGSAIFGKDSVLSSATDPFADPGPTLSMDAQAAVAKAGQMAMDRNLPMGQVMNAMNSELQSQREAARQAINTPGAAPVGGYSVSPATNEIGANFTSPGFNGAIGGSTMPSVNHEFAANAVAGNIDKGGGNIGSGAGADARGGGDYGGGGLGGGPGAEGAGRDPGGPPGSH